MMPSLGSFAMPANATNTVSSQPYLDSDMQSRWYDYGGDTIIRTDS